MPQTICRKYFPAISVSLEKLYETETQQFDAAQSKNDVTRSPFDRTISTFIPLARNIPISPCVYTGAAAYRAVRGKIKKRTPRWQPRGYDTQSFRPLVQEEEVS